jgi:hypothetical protein
MEEKVMADYFNAERILPSELYAAVLKHIPERSKGGAVVYFKDDYYTKRNAEIIALFRIYLSDPHFGSNLEIHEALSEQFGLTVRQISRILQGNREAGETRIHPARRRTEMRVGRVSRRMHVYPRP